MAKKSDIALKYLISKTNDYLDQKILVNLDEVRDIKFNAGKKVEVTEQELNQIGTHRWLIVEESNGD